MIESLEATAARKSLREQAFAVRIAVLRKRTNRDRTAIPEGRVKGTVSPRTRFRTTAGNLTARCNKNPETTMLSLGVAWEKKNGQDLVRSSKAQSEREKTKPSYFHPRIDSGLIRLGLWLSPVLLI
jgi:hypothetical protein